MELVAKYRAEARLAQLLKRERLYSRLRLGVNLLWPLFACGAVYATELVLARVL